MADLSLEGFAFETRSWSNPIAVTPSGEALNAKSSRASGWLCPLTPSSPHLYICRQYSGGARFDHFLEHSSPTRPPELNWRWMGRGQLTPGLLLTLNPSFWKNPKAALVTTGGHPLHPDIISSYQDQKKLMSAAV